MNKDKRRILQLKRDRDLFVYFAYRFDMNVVKIGVCKPERIHARMAELKTVRFDFTQGGFWLENFIHFQLRFFKAESPINIHKRLNGAFEWFSLNNEVTNLIENVKANPYPNWEKVLLTWTWTEGELG